jgi:hypothetical protein
METKKLHECEQGLCENDTNEKCYYCHRYFCAIHIFQFEDFLEMTRLACKYCYEMCAAPDL